jgi:hypothetical protein
MSLWRSLSDPFGRFAPNVFLALFFDSLERLEPNELMSRSLSASLDDRRQMRYWRHFPTHLSDSRQMSNKRSFSAPCGRFAPNEFLAPFFDSLERLEPNELVELLICSFGRLAPNEILAPFFYPFERLAPKKLSRFFCLAWAIRTK